MNYGLCPCCGQQQPRNVLCRDADGNYNGVVVLSGGRLICAGCLRDGNAAYVKAITRETSYKPQPPPSGKAG